MATGVPRAQAPSTPIRYRRDADLLTADQLAALRRGIQAMQALTDDRGHQYYAGIHGLPLPIGCDNAHGTPYFLPWHRAYMYFWERALRDREPTAMLCWWDWRVSAQRPPHIPSAYAVQSVAGRSNPLFSADITPLALEQGGNRVPARTERRPGAPGSPPLPSRDEVTDTLAIRDFMSFSAELERLHDRVHLSVGGHMGQIAYAAYDPVFAAHHCMIDRIWRVWQLGHPGATPPVAILDEALPPFRMTVRQTLSVNALGYDYALFSTSTLARPLS
jgi:tyrosinase